MLILFWRHSVESLLSKGAAKKQNQRLQPRNSLTIHRFARAPAASGMGCGKCPKFIHNMDEIKRQHGGRRQGAGRKAISSEDKKVTITFSMSPDLKRRLQMAADARGISSSKLMAEILDANLPKENSE